MLHLRERVGWCKFSRTNSFELNFEHQLRSAWIRSINFVPYEAQRLVWTRRFIRCVNNHAALISVKLRILKSAATEGVFTGRREWLGKKITSVCSKLIEGNGYETRQTSKEGKKILRFMLEGPRPCTIFCFALMNYVTNTFLLVSSSLRSKQLLCFMQGEGQKKTQKYTTKNFDEFYNHSPLLTMMCSIMRC